MFEFDMDKVQDIYWNEETDDLVCTILKGTPKLVEGLMRFVVECETDTDEPKKITKTFLPNFYLKKFIEAVHPTGGKVDLLTLGNTLAGKKFVCNVRASESRGKTYYNMQDFKKYRTQREKEDLIHDDPVVEEAPVEIVEPKQVFTSFPTSGPRNQV